MICEAIRSISHEIRTKSVECVGIACLGEDVGDIVARADVKNEGPAQKLPVFLVLELLALFLPHES